MAFPTSPTNGQVTVVNQVSYQYSTATNSWTRILSTANIITANTIAVNGAITVGTTASVAGNITSANYFIGNGYYLTGINTGNLNITNIANGTSNVNAGVLNGNITVGIGGTGNVIQWASTGEYVTGVVSAINEPLSNAPELINSDPYGAGWLIKIDITVPPTKLLTPSEYSALTA